MAVNESDVVRYICIARFDGLHRVFLWEGEDPGPARVVVDDRGFVMSFPSEAAAREDAAVHGWRLASEGPSTYDLDAVETWCHSSDDVADCSQLLNAWNLIVDLPEMDGLFRAADARALSIYDKLFRGCNLAAMTPEGEQYAPAWTASETAALKRLLLLGFAELRARLIPSRTHR